MAFLFRADASAAIGAGHVMRCLALAEALQAEGQACRFAASEITPALARRLAASGIEVDRVAGDAAATLAAAQACEARAIVLDGYWFDAAWRKALRAGGLPVLAFSDTPEPPPHADLIVNAAADPVADPTRLYGLDHVLLRRELAVAAALPPADMASRQRILVTFGGTDPLRLTLPVAMALRRRLAVPIDVVVGGSFEDAAGVAGALSALGPGVAAHRDPLAMGGLMRGAGLAVAAAGGTIFELAALGVPGVIAIVAANQERGAATASWCRVLEGRIPDAADRLSEQAAALWADGAERARLSALGRAAVDGRGAERVAAALMALA